MDLDIEKSFYGKPRTDYRGWIFSLAECLSDRSPDLAVRFIDSEQNERLINFTRGFYFNSVGVRLDDGEIVFALSNGKFPGPSTYSRDRSLLIYWESLESVFVGFYVGSGQ